MLSAPLKKVDFVLADTRTTKQDSCCHASKMTTKKLDGGDFSY
jgi:hypothetical protein